MGNITQDGQRNPGCNLVVVRPRSIQRLQSKYLLHWTLAQGNEAQTFQRFYFAEVAGGQRGLCANSNPAAFHLSPLALYATVPGGQFHAPCHWTGALLQGCTVHFNRAGSTESDSPRYPLVGGPGVDLCVCSEILGGRPLKRRFCAFLCHFPGADGVLKLWMQCPSFQASAVSVERMPRLKVRECGVKPIKNETSR